jgi:hypothetical protein
VPNRQESQDVREDQTATVPKKREREEKRESARGKSGEKEQSAARTQCIRFVSRRRNPDPGMLRACSLNRIVSEYAAVSYCAQNCAQLLFVGN